MMNDVSASFRFFRKEWCHGDLRRLATNLIPFPRLHFFSIGESPLFLPNESHRIRISVQEMAYQIFLCKSNFAIPNMNEFYDGKLMAINCGFRGNLPTPEIDDEIAKLRQKVSDDTVQWISSPFKSSLLSIPPINTSISSTLIANTTAIKSVFKKYLNHFKNEPIANEQEKRMQFDIAQKNIKDLINEYQDKQDVVVESEEEEDDDGSDDEDDEDDDYDF